MISQTGSELLLASPDLEEVSTLIGGRRPWARSVNDKE